MHYIFFFLVKDLSIIYLFNLFLAVLGLGFSTQDRSKISVVPFGRSSESRSSRAHCIWQVPSGSNSPAGTEGNSRMAPSPVTILESGIHKLYIVIEGFKWRTVEDTLGGGGGILFHGVGWRPCSCLCWVCAPKGALVVFLSYAWYVFASGVSNFGMVLVKFFFYHFMFYFFHHFMFYFFLVKLFYGMSKLWNCGSGFIIRWISFKTCVGCCCCSLEGKVTQRFSTSFQAAQNKRRKLKRGIWPNGWATGPTDPRKL